MEVLKEGLLKVDPGLLLWTIITFIVLVLIMWRAAWKPLVDALDVRAEKVRSDIENAEKNRIESEQLLAEHERMMDRAKEEATKIIAEGKSDAEKLKDSIVARANSEAKELTERAKKEIFLAKEKALDELKAEVVILSTEIASKIIAKNLKPDDQKAIVEKAIKKLRTVQ
jgi:F-type H+-transporting ATPase subunit b